MKTIQHTLAYVLSCKEYNEDDIRRMVPYVLLPDAIRCFTGPRQYSHFERARNEDDSSWMTFPADMKHLSKEAFAQTESHLCRTDPCVLGEETDLLAFVKHNHDIPDDMFKGVAIHLQQDIIFDEFVRREIDCSRMYEDRFIYNGQEVGGKEVRAIISDMEDDGMRVLAGLVHDKFGITADQKWFDRIVKPALDNAYPKAMAESCYKYMKMSPELNYDIQQHVTETELPADRFVEMYADAATIRGDRKIARGERKMTKEKTFATWREDNIYGRSSERSALCLAGDPDRILRIRQSDVPAEDIPDSAVRMDSEYRNPDAKHKIYAWLTDDGTMNYWTNADMTRLTDESRFLFSELSNVTEIDMSGIDASGMKDMSLMFSDCFRLKSLDLSNWNTSKVTDMSEMFEGCSDLTSLDLSGFDTSGVTNMSGMFYACFSLKSLDQSSFNTSKVEDMSYMFYGCKNLTALDMSNWDTSNVTDMNNMFCDCLGLMSLDVSSFDTSKVTDMSEMFSGCKNLTSLDLSNIDTSKVTDMKFMFDGCKSLSSLDVSGLDTSAVTNMRYMFSRCKNLTSLDLSGFDTSKVKRMYSMFSGCSSLKSLDLSSFNTSEVTDMSSMFYGCESLSSLDVSGFDTSKVMNMNNMFAGCKGLKPFLTSEMAEACGMPALAKSNHEQKNKAARRRNRDQHER